jgi:hypothetical protein
MTAVTCLSSGRCVAASAGTTVVSTVLTTSSHAWISTDFGQTWVRRGDVGVASVFGLTCSTVLRCVSVGSSGSSGAGAAASSDDGGVTWSRLALSYTPNALVDVSCSTSSSCTAVGASTIASLIPN